MNTVIHGRCFTLLDKDLRARIKTLAAACESCPSHYLSEIIENSCLELGKKVHECEQIVDVMVAAWLAIHRSGRPCNRVQIPCNDEDYYTLPRGIRFIDDFEMSC